MMLVKQIKKEIEDLSREDFLQLLSWLQEKGWTKWDNEIEKDSQSGQLDFLIREAKEEKYGDRLREL